ncbi:Carnitine O-acetyltransferase YAT2 [Candida tropicalis]
MTVQQYYTFENEAKLPKIPVPSLVSTTQQLLGSLKPLMPQEDYSDIVSEATEFVSDSLINLIQKHLEAIAENDKYPNYLNFVNNDMTPSIYGEIRGDILPRNPYLILEEDPYSKTINPPNQAQRAANLINSSLKFIITLRNETLKPDITPKNGNPLTMKCYRNLFGTTRIPEFEEHNHDVKMRKYNHINDSRHILIISNNQFYTLEVITEYKEDEYQETKSKHKIWFNDHELSLILQQIIDESNKVDAVKSINNSIGSLTTQTLKHWKLARLELEQSNTENIKKIDDALFVLILDSNTPETDGEKTAVISHGTSVLSSDNVQIGTCTSRWYDKLQLIVTQNSVAGVVWESMSMDSTAILRFISDIYTDSVLKLAKNINGSEYTLFDSNIRFESSSVSKPDAKMIHFNKTKELQNIIHLSETRLADLINQHEYMTHRIKLDSYLTSKFNLSVDSIMQICFQIAYYSLYGRVVNTLEPITTRKFMDARTELIPVQNDALANLVKLYITSASSSEKFEAFKKCCELHTRQYHDAMIGKGFERHLMTIIQVIKKPTAVARLNEVNKHLPPIPDLTKEAIAIPLLLNPAIDKLSSPELLISNCGNPALRLFGIPPAIDQGFGIGYIIHRDKVLITVCSKHRQTERFLDTFHRVVRDLKVNLRQKSNFLLSISDSEQRKHELQRLRIEHELSHVSLDIPSMRHPIPLTLGKNEIPIDNVTLKKDEPDNNNDDTTTTGATKKSDSDEDDEADNFELMGGYGYFDFGELELRSDELSRNDSYLNSQTHSNLSSALSSRRHSFTNLLKIASRTNAQNYDIKEKQSLSERIRDKLSHSEDTLPSGSGSAIDSSADEAEPVEEEEEPTKKSSIGRSLDMSKFN